MLCNSCNSSGISNYSISNTALEKYRRASLTCTLVFVWEVESRPAFSFLYTDRDSKIACALRTARHCSVYTRNWPAGASHLQLGRGVVIYIYIYIYNMLYRTSSARQDLERVYITISDVTSFECQMDYCTHIYRDPSANITDSGFVSVEIISCITNTMICIDESSCKRFLHDCTSSYNLSHSMIVLHT